MKKNKSSINLKMSEDLKSEIKKKADLKQQTISKYIRDLLSGYFDGTLCKAEKARNARNEFVNSTEFLQLIIWMYSVKRSKKFKEILPDPQYYIETLKNTAHHLPKYIVNEFDKVLFDLIRVANLASGSTKDYKFTNGYTSTPEFNFELLEKYLLNYDKSPSISAWNRLNK